MADSTEETDNIDTKDSNKDDSDARIEQEVKLRLKQMKENIDNAYAERDSAKKARAELEAQITKLKAKEEEKKVKTMEEVNAQIEAVNAEKAALQSQVEELTLKITKLTRDNVLSKELSGYDFRNTRATTFATSAVIEELVLKDDNWVGKDDKPLSEVVKAFCENPDHAFLFREKVNKGADLTSTTEVKPDKKVSHEERIKRASQNVGIP